MGTWLAFLLFGGEFPSPELIPRLFVMHILLIPATIVALLSAHLALVWHQTHTQFRPVGTAEDTVTGTPVWPKFALKSVGLAFMTFAVLAGLGGLVQINPVWLYDRSSLTPLRRRRSPISTRDGWRASCGSGRTGSSTSSGTRSASCSCRPS